MCHFCNAIVATTFGTKDAFEKHMEETHNILTNLNVVMAIHTMTDEEKENLMRNRAGTCIWAESRNWRR